MCCCKLREADPASANTHTQISKKVQASPSCVPALHFQSAADPTAAPPSQLRSAHNTPSFSISTFTYITTAPPAPLLEGCTSCYNNTGNAAEQSKLLAGSSSLAKTRSGKAATKPPALIYYHSPYESGSDNRIVLGSSQHFQHHDISASSHCQHCHRFLTNVPARVTAVINILQLAHHSKQGEKAGAGSAWSARCSKHSIQARELTLLNHNKEALTNVYPDTMLLGVLTHSYPITSRQDYSMPTSRSSTAG